MNRHPHNNVEEADELKQIAPALSGIERKNYFTVPDHYFENLAQAIHERCNPISKGITQPWIIFRDYRTVLVVSSVIVLLTIIFFLLYENPWRPLPESQSASMIWTLNDEMTGDLLEEMDENTIMDAMENPSSTFSEDEIIDYLLDENIDIQSINEH